MRMEDVSDMRGSQSLKEEIGELRERIDWGYARIEELMRAMGYLDEKHTRLICNQTTRFSVKWFRVRLVEQRIEKVRQEIFDLRGEVLRWQTEVEDLEKLEVLDRAFTEGN